MKFEFLPEDFKFEDRHGHVEDWDTVSVVAAQMANAKLAELRKEHEWVLHEKQELIKSLRLIMENPGTAIMIERMQSERRLEMTLKELTALKKENLWQKENLVNLGIQLSNIKAEIEDGVVVYGLPDIDEPQRLEKAIWSEERCNGDTHTARLVRIEILK